MKISRSFVAILYLGFSFLGLILIAALTNLLPPMQYDVPWRKPLVGTLFSVVCVLGVLAGIFPSKCSSIFHFGRVKQEEVNQESVDLSRKALALRGHHPVCGYFRAHVFRIGKRVFCAGCVGLVLGAVLSLFGVTTYFFINLHFWSNYLVFWIGFVGVSCGLLQYHLFNWGRSSIHLSVNAFFAFGVFFLLTGIDGITQNVIIDFYLIVLSIFWLYTRILLSQLDHKIICTNCRMEECEFHERKSVESS